MESLKNEYKVLIVPGLGDGNRWLEWMARNWSKKYGIQPESYVMPWLGDEQTFGSKLERFLGKVDSLTKEGKKISLIGVSAGGSAVLNAFTLRQHNIHKVISVCGRLKVGENVYPTLEQAGRRSRAFIESVQMFEEAEKSLDNNSRRNILTIRPLYDEVVPISTMTIEGASNVQIVSVEHMLSIAAAMSIYSRHIIDHILSEDIFTNDF